MPAQIKLVPPFSTPNDEFLNLVSRSGYGYVEVNHLYDLWPHLSDRSVLIVSMDTHSVAILQRHMDTLLEHVPTVVTGVTGAFYSSEWNMLTAHLVSEPYAVIESQMLKSGYKSLTTDQAVSRGHQVMVAPAASPNSEETSVVAHPTGHVARGRQAPALTRAKGPQGYNASSSGAATSYTTPAVSSSEADDDDDDSFPA